MYLMEINEVIFLTRTIDDEVIHTMKEEVMIRILGAPKGT